MAAKRKAKAPVAHRVDGPAEPITGPMADALAALRDRANALFAQARRTYPDLDAPTFGAALAGLGRPVVDAAEAAAPGRAEAVTAVVYEVLLGLVGKGLGADPAVTLAWRDVLPALAGPLAADPAGVIGPVTNAAWTLTAMHGVEADDWAARMVAVGGAGPALDADGVRAAGLVAAWRGGLAHGREAALAAAATLDPTVAGAALGVGPGADVPDLLARLAADRWAAVDGAAGTRELRVMARMGAFRGFGGPFLVPPLVATDGVGVLVRASTGPGGADDFWDLYADRFGATLVRRAAPEVDPVPPAAGATVDADGTVALAGDRGSFPMLAGPTSWTATADTLVVTTDRTHAVVILAVAEADAEPTPGR